MAGRKTSIPYADLLRIARDAHRGRPDGALLAPGEFMKHVSRGGGSCAWPTADAVLTALSVEQAGAADRLREIKHPELRRAVEAAWADGSSIQLPLPGGDPLSLDESGWTPALAHAMGGAEAAMREVLAAIGGAAGAALRAGREDADARIKRGQLEMLAQLESVRAQLRDVEVAAETAARDAAEELRATRDRAALAEKRLNDEIQEVGRARAEAAADLRVARSELASARAMSVEWQTRHDSLREATDRLHSQAEEHRERATKAEASVAALGARVDASGREVIDLRARCENAEAGLQAAAIATARHEERIAQLEIELTTARGQIERYRRMRRRSRRSDAN